MECEPGVCSGKADDSGERNLVWIYIFYSRKSNLFMSLSLKEVKSSTMFSKRVGIAAALNYEIALVKSVV